MKIMKFEKQSVILAVLLLAAPAAVQAQFTYTNADGSIYDYSTNADGVSLTITGYTGPPWAVTIPTNINGLPVTNIGTNAFYDLTNLTSITIPSSVTSIGCAGKSGAGAPALQNLADLRSARWRAKRLGARARQRRFAPPPGLMAHPEEFCLTPELGAQ